MTNTATMKKLILFSLCLLFQVFSKAQLMIPVFEEPKIEKKLSSDGEDMIPLTYNKGEGMFLNRIYLVGSGDNQKISQQDLWFAESKNGEWKAPYRLFRDLDSKEINLLVGCSIDGQRIYLLNRTAVEDSIYSGIFYRDRDDKNGWQDKVKVEIPGLNVDDPQATIFMHPDGDVLLMSMLVEGSGNNEDLYLWHKDESGNWSERIHLGDRVNSLGLEFSPFLTLDKKALYFASDGHGGFGQSDIFVAYREPGSWTNWSRPLNLGLPINSSNFESDFMISDSTHVYFSSDRLNDNNDIFSSKATGEYKMANLGVLAGKLYKQAKPISGVGLNAFSTQGEFVEFVKTDEKGEFTFVKLFPDDNFNIKLDTAKDHDVTGSKLYIVDGEGNLRKRIVYEDGAFVNDAQAKNKELIQGFFMSGESPMINTALVISDENGYPIDTIYTNDKGKFSYEKLALDKDIVITPRDLEGDDLLGMDLYLVDENGNRTKSFLGKSDETGKGIFIYNGLPLANTIIKVLDENGDVLEVLVLNQNGKFTYKQLAMYEDGALRLESEDGADLIDGIIYVKDSKGKTKRYIVKTGNTAVDIASEGSTAIFGKYTYNKLPAANTALQVIDANGIPIDTIYTDELGRFNYNKLNLDGEVFFKPLDSSDDLALSLIEMTNKQGKVTSELVLGEKGFSSLAAKKKQKEQKPTLKVESVFYYFDFNEAELSAGELKGLRGLVDSKLIGNQAFIELVGHADNVGGQAGNQKISRLRAEYVKEKLIEYGMEARQIKVSYKGASKPVASNDTEEGRAKNRRVELKVTSK